jgi:hypothetical protein
MDTQSEPLPGKRDTASYRCTACQSLRWDLNLLAITGFCILHLAAAIANHKLLRVPMVTNIPMRDPGSGPPHHFVKVIG